MGIMRTTGKITITNRIKNQTIPAIVPDWSSYTYAEITGPSNSYFGQQVSISNDGSFLAVTAPRNNTDSLSYNGTIFIYENINNTFSLHSSINGTANSEYIGKESISINDDCTRIMFSTSSSIIKEYIRSGTSWTAGQTFSGTRVHISRGGQSMVVVDSGDIKVYSFNGTTWSLEEILSDSGGTEILSAEISYDGTRVVGLYTGGPIGGYTLKIFSFIKSGGVWSQEFSSSEPTTSAFIKNFGKSTSYDGTEIFVGDSQKDTTDDANGIIYRYDGFPPVKKQEIITDLNTIHVYLGKSLDMDNNNILYSSKSGGVAVYILDNNDNYVINNHLYGTIRPASAGVISVIKNGMIIVNGFYSEDTVVVFFANNI